MMNCLTWGLYTILGCAKQVDNKRYDTYNEWKYSGAQLEKKEIEEKKGIQRSPIIGMCISLLIFIVEVFMIYYIVGKRLGLDTDVEIMDEEVDKWWNYVYSVWNSVVAPVSIR